VLQRVNPIFSARVNRDIDVVTRHLRAKGLAAPELLPTANGALWLEHDGGVWRTLGYVDGVTHESAATPERAREAGRLLGAFHVALGDLDHRFENVRLGVHDTAKHLAALTATVATRTAHPSYPAVAALAAEIEALAAGLAPLPAAPDRIVHGDPKISNVVFEPDNGRAICLIDLDTLSRMPIALELGDALRSWCNPGAEDGADAAFSTALCAAAVEGYAADARGLLEPAEWGAIPLATLTISVELAARFCADALEESYFGWDAARYASASDHNQARTRAQLGIAHAIRAATSALETLVREHFA
jgi:Ser/Thr protein kinase RdoA (MazF antagonist)